MKNIEYGCCIFTVDDEFARAPYETLYALKEMGYSYTEFGNFGEHSVSTWKNLFNKSGVGLKSLHFNIEYMEAWFEHIVEFIESMQAGTRYIGCPALRSGKSDTVVGYLEEAEVMNKLGRRFKERGLQFVYHNHAFEFENLGGKLGLDILFENTDPDDVKFELDTFWIKYGGQDPVEYIEKFAGRCPVIHLKDITESKQFAPVGEGILDFGKIIPAAIKCGAKDFLVEQDEKHKPSLECAKISSNTIKKILNL
jgi:sugar phosphate isomerase/epimerase